jgi:prepilin-type N-terminal cleavage/methylation domain-containing protein
MFISQDNGFTLLEVLVALVIAALALIVMFRAGGDGLVAVNTASRYEEAIQRAQTSPYCRETPKGTMAAASDGDCASPR